MKRIISILLAVLLLVSCAVVAASAYGNDDPSFMTVKEALDIYEMDYGTRPETNRYYFLMPNGSNGDLGDDDSETGKYGQFAPTWYKTFDDGTPATNTAAIYWWQSGVADPIAWVGYGADGHEESDPNVYYVDAPKAATMIVWNNAVDGGQDSTKPVYFCAAQTGNIPCEYYEPGENEHYPEGTESFDNMIYVIDPDLVTISDFSQMQTCGGEWYYYYGDGCYGYTKDGTTDDCLRGDHDHSVNYLLGDVDGDGDVSILDATEIQLVLAQLKEWNNDTAVLAADYDGDGDVSVLDATEIQLVLAGLK